MKIKVIDIAFKSLLHTIKTHGPQQLNHFLQRRWIDMFKKNFFAWKAIMKESNLFISCREDNIEIKIGFLHLRRTRGEVVGWQSWHRSLWCCTSARTWSPPIDIWCRSIRIFCGSCRCPSSWYAQLPWMSWLSPLQFCRRAFLALLPITLKIYLPPLLFSFYAQEDLRFRP